jgi:hypothetical protein
MVAESFASTAVFKVALAVLRVGTKGKTAVSAVVKMAVA